VIISVPVLVERIDGLHTLRPLYSTAVVESHRDLDRGLARFVRRLRELLDGRGREDRHEALAAFAFNPTVQSRVETLTLYLKRKTVRLRVLLVSFSRLGRRVAFTPSFPDVWFLADRGEDVVERATHVLTKHLADLVREGDGDGAIDFESFGLQGKAWLTNVDVECSPRSEVAIEEESEERFAFLDRSGPIDGAEELSTVARCLDAMYPGELTRAFGREREVEALARSLRAEGARPVVVLGRSKAGKTAVIHENIYRTIDSRGGQFALDQRTWAIAPQRLISGMSYVGQWEERLLAILEEAEKRKHVLYFDDYVGLYRAGVTVNSTLSVGHVLKPFIQRGQVQILAEATPETWRVLRERDRGLVDQFEVVRVEEPEEQACLRMLIGVIRELEARHECWFEPDVLPLAVDLTRRFSRHLAFPGKAAVLLRRLAVKHPKQRIDRDATIEAFRSESGLAVRFLDDQKKLPRADITTAISQRIIGQRAAVDAMADVVSVAKARLNDPTRPLASFLFIGPTGVGKTECAKALATYLFSDKRRLVRFDMNEFIDPTAAGRLVGTFGKPDGLLTSAIRRTPFAVVLLDEIEKAHPDVTDLLLQLLDDGRLTDALGRTADFSAAIVILTSNLGVMEANRRLGFGATAESAAGVYRRVAERFFRPELFNRIDRLVAFEQLDRSDMRRIAEKVIEDVLGREGLARRKCILDVEATVLDRVAEEGYHPELGARAMKRVVERTITRGVAGPLAATLPDAAAVLHVSDRRGRLHVEVEQLEQAEPALEGLVGAPGLSDAQVVDRVQRIIDRLERRIEPLRPQGSFAADDLAPEHELYFETRERLDDLVARLGRLGEVQSARPNLTGARLSGYHARGIDRSAWKLDELIGAQDFKDALDELLATTDPGVEPSTAAAVMQESAYLDALAGAGSRAMHEQVQVSVQRLGGGGTAIDFDAATGVLTGLRGMGVESNPLGGGEYLLEGPLARRLIGLEEGVHLVWMSKGLFVTFRLQILDASRRPPKIVRVYERHGTILDVRTQTALRDRGELDKRYRELMLSQFPAPPELTERAKG